MKRFGEFLTEAKKEYHFKIGIAGQLPENFEDNLESCLQKYSVANMSTAKKTPIQERPLDFPHLQNTEVHYFEVTLNYPTIDNVLQEYIANCCDCAVDHIRVVNPHAQDIADGVEIKKNTPYEPLLDNEYQDPVSSDAAQQNVGGNKVMDLLAELEKARKERENDPMESAPKGESQDVTNEENATSPIGS